MASEMRQPWEPTKDHALLHIYDGGFIRHIYLEFNLPIPKPPHHVSEIEPIGPWFGHAEVAGDADEDEQQEQQQHLEEQGHHRRRAFRFSTLAGLFIVFLCIILPLFPSLEPLVYLGLAAFWLAS
ncbi:hypothetical protein QBC33DRAFT_562414 [Phialemonium atrogriseum]|uniref:Uncharacterized protein n=1 Tax=Phialemonium atrogriseum TaxID=1093897 RepID=A0AAJ0FIZ7_9PEZI|nr:uncharacterized protein QBC33DRAFT_562414 [Phialemonium atrogriseum]KAK1763829.1 hypothetical protein QBC33DRAFT_562414 [Phialemonium atrogriseum]